MPRARERSDWSTGLGLGGLASASEPAVSVQGISKRFRLGGKGLFAPAVPFYRRFQRDGLAGVDDVDDDGDVNDAEDAGGELQPHLDLAARTIWALRDVTFDIERGTSVAILGPNASGKTTLIKILSRITPPTAGRIVLRGRAMSLLDVVGTLIDPDATGQQNVLLLARFLGIPDVLTRRRMDEVLTFAGLEHQRLTKVRHYSSGQARRLPFAIVLNLYPQILLADDSLVPGDRGFREDCLSLIHQRLSEGMTLVFATHDLTLAERMCNRAIRLEEGAVVAQGSLAEVVAAGRPRPAAGSAESRRSGLAGRSRAERRRTFNEHVAIVDTRLVDEDGFDTQVLQLGRRNAIRATVEVATQGALIRCVAVLVGPSPPRIRMTDLPGFDAKRPGVYEVEVEIPWELLAEGHYDVQVNAVAVVGDANFLAVKKNAFSFDVVGADRPLPQDLPLELQGLVEVQPGKLKPPVLWKVVRRPGEERDKH